MAKAYLVRLTGPQITALREAADNHEQYLTDNPGSGQALRALQNAHAALVRAQVSSDARHSSRGTP